ncbi:hypothetical protein [Urbifossiella limnaea]|uniref:Uncharacterized protein n=1 Tax=Urbifossiella limnaea TaxID=2528023 RepID=A0A517XX74_9BACT|nr:hypothetical protein [Urbifossiella limnaea]QDU22103.1 hypothetical protein ETAA1_40780 [Urbifossiella limnaea]
MSVPADLAADAAGDPAALAAIQFVQDFTPKPGVDYAWVEENARKAYELTAAAFDALDAKAGAIIGYVGAGAGLAAFGTVNTAATAAVHPAVAAAAVPTILFAVAALVFAARCRKSEPVYTLPSAIRLARRAEQNATAAEARAYLIPQWNLSAAMLRVVIRRKGELVDNATWCFGCAVASLLLPLLAVACTRNWAW